MLSHTALSLTRLQRIGRLFSTAQAPASNSMRTSGGHGASDAERQQYFEEQKAVGYSIHRVVQDDYLATAYGAGSGQHKAVHSVALADLEVDAQDPNCVSRARDIYREHGCVVVRGLNREHAAEIRAHATSLAQQSLSLLDQAKEIPEGWLTPDGTLLIPCPAEHAARLGRDKQIMILGMDYYTSAAMFRAATNPLTLDLCEAILDPEGRKGIELFGKGQMFFKEPLGGIPKLLHQVVTPLGTGSMVVVAWGDKRRIYFVNFYHF